MENQKGILQYDEDVELNILTALKVHSICISDSFIINLKITTSELKTYR